MSAQDATAIARSAIAFGWDSVPSEQVTPHMRRQVIAGEELMLARITLNAGHGVDRHRHVSEQITLVLEGQLRFWVGEQDDEHVDVPAGQMIHLPSNVPHRAQALAPTVNLDVFAPPREEWRGDKTVTLAEQ